MATTQNIGACPSPCPPRSHNLQSAQRTPCTQALQHYTMVQRLHSGDLHGATMAALFQSTCGDSRLRRGLCVPDAVVIETVEAVVAGGTVVVDGAALHAIPQARLQLASGGQQEPQEWRRGVARAGLELGVELRGEVEWVLVLRGELDYLHAFASQITAHKQQTSRLHILNVRLVHFVAVPLPLHNLCQAPIQLVRHTVGPQPDRTCTQHHGGPHVLLGHLRHVPHDMDSLLLRVEFFGGAPVKA
mmetsp:Transcript_5304/g.9564  ORF Transcript_5304/g.9564 Transcript_5304/m.9564 type:complete len:245 (+) Transcript_5304:984-1718(+)